MLHWPERSSASPDAGVVDIHVSNVALQLVLFGLRALLVVVILVRIFILITIFFFLVFLVILFFTNFLIELFIVFQLALCNPGSITLRVQVLQQISPSRIVFILPSVIGVTSVIVLPQLEQNLVLFFRIHPLSGYKRHISAAV